MEKNANTTIYIFFFHFSNEWKWTKEWTSLCLLHLQWHFFLFIRWYFFIFVFSFDDLLLFGTSILCLWQHFQSFNWFVLLSSEKWALHVTFSFQVNNHCQKFCSITITVKKKSELFIHSFIHLYINTYFFFSFSVICFLLFTSLFHSFRSIVLSLPL